MTIGLLYRVGNRSLVGLLSSKDSEGWISYSTESFLAVPSAARRFSIIIKPVETRNSTFLHGRYAKCQGTALEEGSIAARFLG